MRISGGQAKPVGNNPNMTWPATVDIQALKACLTIMIFEVRFGGTKFPVTGGKADLVFVIAGQ